MCVFCWTYGIVDAETAREFDLPRREGKVTVASLEELWSAMHKQLAATTGSDDVGAAFKKRMKHAWTFLGCAVVGHPYDLDVTREDVERVDHMYLFPGDTQPHPTPPEWAVKYFDDV